MLLHPNNGYPRTGFLIFIYIYQYYKSEFANINYAIFIICKFKPSFVIESLVTVWLQTVLANTRTIR